MAMWPNPNLERTRASRSLSNGFGNLWRLARAAQVER